MGAGRCSSPSIPWPSRNNELLCGDHTFLVAIPVPFKVRALLELEEEKRSMRWAVRLTLNECHRNWRFYKLWLLITELCHPCHVYVIKAATGKCGRPEEQAK